VPILLRELSYRVTFYYPTLKPYLLSDLLASDAPYTKRMLTSFTPPPLLSIAVGTILFGIVAMTPRALFLLINELFLKPV